MFLDLCVSPKIARLLFLALAGLFVAHDGAERAAGASPEVGPSSPLARRAALAGPFEARAVRVIDGDTFEARVRIWFGQELQTLVRLRGVDAPELASRCADERRRAIAARDHLALMLETGALRLRDVALDKYGGRVVADVVVTDAASGPEDVVALMRASGHARAYSGARRASWCGRTAKETADLSVSAAIPDASAVATGAADQSPPSFPSLSAQR